MVLLAEEGDWAGEMEALRRQGLRVALFLASGPDAYEAAEEMAIELGRGTPWRVLDRRPKSLGMPEGI